MARAQTQRFSDEVEAALKAVLPSDDPLDQPDFDPVDYINSRFQTERSLDGLDSFIVEVRQKLRASEGRLLDAVKVQATTASKAADDLKSAKTAVEELHQRVTDIKTKAEASENMVSGICDSIRHLDTAKANLSKSIKTLNNLQLYIRNIHNLGIAIEAKEWSSVNTSLRQAQDFRTKFKPFEETPKIRELADKLTQHEKQLEFQLCSSVIRDLQANETNKNEEALREACLVVDALGQETVSKFRQKFISALLEPYAAMFRKNTEDAAFEKTERRFIFIKQILENKKSLFWNVFPRGWSVAQELCVDFCLRTNKEISAHLREETDIDIAVLVYILQRTIEFEKELTIRMRTLQAEIDEEQLGNGAPAQQLSEYRYYGLIVKCFDSHMDKYVLHEGELLEKTVAQSIESDSVVEDLLVLQSSQDVFLCIQESSSRSARFAGESTMAELARVWLKNLRNYTQHLMLRVATAPQGPSACEDYCIIINSADFCRGATEGIGVDLSKSAESELATLVDDIDGTMDGFAKLSTTANQQLVDGFCQRLQPVLAELQAYLAVISGGGNSDSAHLEGSAFDESAASKKLRREYTEIVRLAAKSLQPHCFPFLLNRFASTFISKFWAMALYRPKARHSDLSISQLLIDCKALENMFLSVPNEVINAAAKSHTQFSRASVLGAANKPGAQNDGPRIHLATYTKTVKREIGYLSMALKVLQLPAGDGFVQLYHQITPQEKRSLTDCTRLLDLKGVKPEDTRQLIALLKKRADVPVTTPRDALYETAQKSSVLSGIFSSRDDPPSASSPSAGRPSAQRRSEDPGNGESGNQEESAWKRLRGAAALAFNKAKTRD